MLRIFKLTTGNKFVLHKTYKDYGYEGSDKLAFVGKNVKLDIKNSTIGEILFVGNNTKINKYLTTYGEVRIGTNCIIGENVTADDGTYIRNHVHLERYVQVRTNSIIGRRSYIREGTVIGHNVTIHDSVFTAKYSKIYHNSEILPFSNVYCIKNGVHRITVYFDGNSGKIQYVLNRYYEMYDNLLSVQNALGAKPSRLKNIVKRLRERHKL